MENTGFNIEAQQEAELDPRTWRFGTSAIIENITIDDLDWRQYFSKGVNQYDQFFDTMACVSFSAVRIQEAIFNAKIKLGLISLDNLIWLNNNGYLDELGQVNFSERHIAMLSGTTKSGNSGWKVNETIKNSGLIPNSKWPFNPSMQWDTYYSVIPQSLLDLGLEFKGRFQFAYELVPTSKEAMTSGLAHSPIQVYLFAWEQPVNGIYQRTFKVPNHAVSNGHPEWYIEDHYVPYEKELAPDFLFYGSGYKYNWTEINNNNTTMTNVMIGKDSNGPAMYWVVPISHPEAFKSECINYGKVCPLSSDEVSVDWSKVKVEAIINKQ